MIENNAPTNTDSIKQSFSLIQYKISHNFLHLLIIAYLLTVSVTVLGINDSQNNNTKMDLGSISIKAIDTSDEALIYSLPGFKNGYAEVNGIRLHYVTGGKGAPLILLPGWPQIWWEYHKVMPALAKHFRVIVVDLRGMGSSSKPISGYDKKTMAADIHALINQLGYQQVYIAGHDIGSMVAYSFATNYPQATRRLIMIEVPHPFSGFTQIQMLPHKSLIDNTKYQIYPWWFAFNQVPGLAETLLAGRFHLLQDWLFNYMLIDTTSISSRDRAIYAAAYSREDAIRAGNGWYQTFIQDIADNATYEQLKMPVLGLGAASYGFLELFLRDKAQNLRMVKLKDAGHFIPEENPKATVRILSEFFKE